MTKIEELLKLAVGKGIDEWLADGRESFRPAIAAIPDFDDLVISKILEQAAYHDLLLALEDGAQETNVVTGLIGLAKAVIPLLLTGI